MWSRSNSVKWKIVKISNSNHKSKVIGLEYFWSKHMAKCMIQHCSISMADVIPRPPSIYEEDYYCNKLIFTNLTWNVLHSHKNKLLSKIWDLNIILYQCARIMAIKGNTFVSVPTMRKGSVCHFDTPFSIVHYKTDPLSHRYETRTELFPSVQGCLVDSWP